MIETVQAVCKALSARGASVGDIAALLGEIETAGGAHHAMIVTPKDDGFARVEIKPGSTADTPYTVELTVSESSKTTLAALRKAFGESTFVPRMRTGQSDRVQFWVDDGKSDYTCAIFASYGDGERVEGLLIRRDEREDED